MTDQDNSKINSIEVENASIEIVSSKEETLKSKKPKKKLAIEWIALIVVTVFFAAVFGSNCGYYIYSKNNPIKDKNYIGSASEIPTDEQMKKVLDAGTLLTSYENTAYQVLNYSFFKQASYKYSLSITTGKTHALIADQVIKSAALTTPECDYYENISSGFTSTAYRFFDYKDSSNTLKSLMCSKESDWGNKTPDDMTYDDYIQKFGKLYKGKYYVTYDTDDSSKSVPDVYLTDNETDYKAAVKVGKSANPVTGISIYNMNSKTVTSSTIEKIDGGYRINVTFDVSKGACSYFKAQMKTTGGVTVSFVSSTIIYEIDEELNLIHGKTIDSYKTMGVTADQLLNIYYYHNDVESVYDKQMILVPKTNSTDTFKGYDLLPSED